MTVHRGFRVGLVKSQDLPFPPGAPRRYLWSLLRVRRDATVVHVATSAPLPVTFICEIPPPFHHAPGNFVSLEGPASLSTDFGRKAYMKQVLQASAAVLAVVEQ